MKTIQLRAAFVATCIIVAPAFGQFPAPVTSPAALNTNAASDTSQDGGVRAATDGKGRWIAVWSVLPSFGSMNSDLVAARSDDNGESWSPPEPINGNTAATNAAPDLATDGQGNWVVVWISNDNLDGTASTNNLDIHVARSNNNGDTWSSPAALNGNAANDNENDLDPQIATDAAGHWVVVWTIDDGFGGTLGSDKDIMVSRSTDNGEMWTFPAPLNNNAVSDNREDDEPSLVTDRQGHWIAIWESTEIGPNTDADIFASRSTDNGATWSDPGPLNNNADTDSGADFDPAVATDGLGNWVAVWNSENDLSGSIGNENDIHFARSTDNGATWTDPAPLNTNAANDIGFDEIPSISTDGMGNWVAGWDGNNPNGGNSSYDAFIAYSSDNGQTWTDPFPFTGFTFDQGGDAYVPRAVPDGRGNWIITFETYVTPEGAVSDYDILLSRFAFPDCDIDGVGDGQQVADGTRSDCDGDGIPDQCEADSDGDGVIDACDNCPDVVNVDQADSDGNGVGDACDTVNGGCGACGAGAGMSLLLMLMPSRRMIRRGQPTRRRQLWTQGHSST